jgi:surface polysaccharide O-acyltransferase-like enzyme
MKHERVVFLDWLRVIACFMVMAIHSAEPFYLGGEAPNITHIASRWDMLWITVTECLCRVCVPLFVMTSSYLLFPVNRPTGEFFRRRLMRVVVPFAVWAVAYIWAAGGDWGRLFFNFPDEGGHLWFVPMLLGLYLIMPLLSPWAEKVTERELKGWLAVWLLTTTFPFLRRAWEALYGAPSFGAVPYLYGECPWNMFGTFHYVSGFVGYMLLGLWFRKFAAKRNWARTVARALPLWIAGVAIVGIPFFFYTDKFPFSAPYAHAVKMEMSIEYCSLGVALATIAAFMVLRKLDVGGTLYEKVVRPISEASYGMYLLHMFILAPVSAMLIPCISTPLAILATAMVSFAASAVAALVLRRIPVVGKWIC